MHEKQSDSDLTALVGFSEILLISITNASVTTCLNNTKRKEI